MMNKRYRKTYGVRGLLEWHMTLYAGKAMVRIHFSGGLMGSNGVIPAKYTTDSPAIQKLIEGSRYFRGGMIYIHGDSVEIGGDKPHDCIALQNIERDDCE